MRIKERIKKNIIPGGFLWRLLVLPQRLERHGPRILLKGRWEAKKMKRMVEPLKTRKFIKDHVSVVITSAGRGAYLQKTIESLRPRFEYDKGKTSWLIIDDYPSDENTRRYIRSLDIFDRVILNEENRGLGYSLNRIFSEVQSEFIFYCQDDFEFLRSVPVGEMIQILRANPNLIQLVLSRDKPFVGAESTSRGYREYHRMFGFWPYLAPMERLFQYLPFPFYFTNIDFSFKVLRDGRYTSGIFGEEASPHVRHLGETQAVRLVK